MPVKHRNKQQFVGQALPRQEDDKLLTGSGCFANDVKLQDELHISFVRSMFDSGKIVSCDFGDALNKKGVIACYSGHEVDQLGYLSVNPILGPLDNRRFEVLCNETVHAVGQPIAGVLATTKMQADDAAECIFVDIEEREKTKNQSVFQKTWTEGDPSLAFADADYVVDVEIQHPRVAACSMETRSIAVEYDKTTDSVIIWLSTQTPHRARQELSNILSVDEEKLAVVARDVGGAFGMKGSLYPEEVFAVWAAFKLERSVRWNATRNEDLLSASHGRGLLTRGSLAFSKQGKFLALKAQVHAPLGAWLTNSAAIPAWNAARILPGPYAVSNYEVSTVGIESNTAPVGIYRGAGRPEAAMLMERLADKAAKLLAIDPFELREKNLLKSNCFPDHRTTGVVLDSGNYLAALKLLKEQSCYRERLQNQDKRRRDGEIIGVGIAFFLEPSGKGWESATVRLQPDGRVEVFFGGSSQGQGRQTALAQIVADIFCCTIDSVQVFHSDTRTCPPGIGALASRSTPIGASAVVTVARQVLKKSLKTRQSGSVIEATVKYECDGEAWGYGCYLAQVKIDADTGVLTLEDLICVDDAGTQINPTLVEGQIMGGLAQGIGEAMLENLVYDEFGQLITGSLMDYCLPRADDMPDIEMVSLTTPSPMNLTGAKGVGEAGTIGAPAAIMNAALNALSPMGIQDLEMPLTSETIWQAMRKENMNGSSDQ